MCRPPSFLVVKKKVTPKRSFKSAENRAASSLWVGDHRYTRYLCASKLLWVYYVPKVEANPRPIRNLRKSLLFLKSLKTYQTSRSLGNYEGIDFATEKNCSVFSWPSKVSKSNRNSAGRRQEFSRTSSGTQQDVGRNSEERRQELRRTSAGMHQDVVRNSAGRRQELSRTSAGTQ